MRTDGAKSYCSRANSRRTVLRWLVAIGFGLSTVADTAPIVKVAEAAAAEKRATEYQIKAVYLYNFLLFSEWPDDQSGKPKDSIIVGIIGKDSFRDAFKEVEGKPVNGRKLIIRRFKSDAPLESLKKCDLLFISSSLKKKARDLIKLLASHAVLTVSETGEFVDLGGMIDLVKKKDTIKLEINKAAAERVGIKFRSKLLRVAARVVENSDGEKDTKQEG